MITEDCVSFETAKLLKEKGFSEWCHQCYGVAVLHNGENISFDEECDLKDEGRENEIEYVEGGILHNCGCNNRDYSDVNVWAAPSLWVAMKWLREKYNLHIIIECGYGNRLMYFSNIKYTLTNESLQNDTGYYNTCEEACEAAIKYCLEKLI